MRTTRTSNSLFLWEPDEVDRTRWIFLPDTVGTGDVQTFKPLGGRYTRR
jgi:hypothetical protein